MNESKYYNDILNKYGDFIYEAVDFKTIFNFDTSNIELIKKYEIDKLVASEHFIQCLMNVCQYVYRIVPHNKPILSNPYAYSGFDILQKHLKNNSLNCAGYSILYNDIMLTLGYTSKCIFCRPYDLYDDDSHVLCQVYNHEENKWIVVDPAQGCIPCDENETCFDIIELRNAIKSNKPLKLMRSKNSYHQITKTLDYVKYLNKYLFMFLVIDEYGLKYDMSTQKLIIPQHFVCSDFDVPFKCQITYNKYYLLN